MWEGGIWVLVALFFVFGPFSRRRAWGHWGQGDKRLGQAGPAKQQDEHETLRRDEQVLQLETRVAELESRLDFAERLLAERRHVAIPPQ